MRMKVIWTCHTAVKPACISSFVRCVRERREGSVESLSHRERTRQLSGNLSEHSHSSSKVQTAFLGPSYSLAFSLLVILIIQRRYRTLHTSPPLSIFLFTVSVFVSWYWYGAFRIPDAKLS
jgi:hypothetical protein